MPNDGPPAGYVTSAEACARLGISDRTLRRRVAAGTIDGEYLARPQGSVLYVKLPAETAVDTAHTADAVIDSETEQAAEDTATVPPALTEPPGVVVGLLEDLREMRQQQRNDASLIADLRERLGRAETGAEWVDARLVEVEIDLARERKQVDELGERLRQAEARLAARLRRPWWSKLWG